MIMTRDPAGRLSRGSSHRRLTRMLFARRKTSHPGIGRAALALILISGSCAGTAKPPASAPTVATATPAGAGAVPAPGIQLAPIDPIKAPFPMPDLQRPQFPAATFDVRQYGAVADGTTKN